MRCVTPRSVGCLITDDFARWSFLDRTATVSSSGSRAGCTTSWKDCFGPSTIGGARRPKSLERTPESWQGIRV